MPGATDTFQPLVIKTTTWLRIFLFVLIAASAPYSNAQPTPPLDPISAGATITHGDFVVQVTTPPSGPCVATLSSTVTAPTQLHHFTLDDPARLVIDIVGLTVRQGKTFPIGQSQPCFSAVRFGQGEGKTRIVFDVPAEFAPDYRVEQRGSTLTFVFGEGSRSATRTVVATATIPVPSLQSTQKEIVVLSGRRIEPRVLTPIGAPIPPIETSRAEGDSPPIDVGRGFLSAGGEIPAMVRVESPTPVPHEQTPLGQPPHVFHDEARPDLRFKVDQVMVQLPSTTPTSKTLVVTNVSASTLYMSIRVVRVEQPGSEREEEIATEALLASPKLFELAPGGQRRIRLVAVTPAGQIETAYRVYLTPLDSDFEEQIKVPVNDLPVRPPVTTALTITVLRDPLMVRGGLRESRSAGVITLENIGNVHASLTSIKICDRSNNNCQELPDRLVFPGTSATFDVSPSSKIELLQKVASQYQPLLFMGAE